ncbi:MAG: tRNA (cytidine(34)-2'-O)-methyltransferase [Lentisphaerae bacterium]|nr:tRNA (cytidine(34)-2'-O)-methyltransferase [Lentisphaerota bacterium]
MKCECKNEICHRRHAAVKLVPPAPPLRVVLLEPEIPPNTGNIARLCAATATPLHLVGPLGFKLTDAAVRRAGLDYWHEVQLTRHADMRDFFRAVPPEQCHFFSTSGRRSHTSAAYVPGAALVFGSESRGLPDDLLAAHAARVWSIPMFRGGVRSLNLATATAVVLYEALRQLRAWSS